MIVNIFLPFFSLFLLGKFLTSDQNSPQVNCAEAKSDDDRDEAGDDLHVLLVGHREDDEEEQGRAQHLVHRQAHCCHLNFET